MLVCPKCGRDNEDDSRFCSGCATPLAAPAELPREERKTVTVLFADLVGFTSKAERLDPEDVRALLLPYYARLRAELEHHGGRVEKFIGDAVMAVFGAPASHEDDPERAVRAALAIREWIREQGDNLQARIAINTGEALVALGARPTEGEGMVTGDVVNTAARLQSAAPVNGILVGEATYRATRQAVEYREAEPVEAKGKEQPVPVWEALQARARFGVDVPHEARTPLVGRDRELELLRHALERVRAERSPQLVTLVGVPGIGKSRLLYELSQIVDAVPELISWRQGRSLPYGEGISFWALAEIVKAQAGILETDDADEAGAKLSAAVAEVLHTERDAEWVRRHVGALIGLGSDASAGQDRRSEAFAAWRRFLEALAEQRPLVLVFEDLHWADDGVLDFVDHLIDWATGVPILVVASARPELLERRPGWGGGKPNTTTLSLSPLADEEAARMIGTLLGRPAVEATRQAELLDRVGGNPLYAEQYVQMLGERNDGDELPLPESIQGIVGARLDALAPEEKQLLQDAAVVGKVFWPGAVAAFGGGDDRFRLEERLHLLERKQFVRRERRSSVAEETQYAFQHLLLRDVAYNQIPRAARVAKHADAAAWIESLARPEDHAEMVAHHYLRALELASAAHQDAGELVPRARVALGDAGDRAHALNSYSAAARFYREALALWPEEAVRERVDLLFRLALAMFDADEEGRDEALAVARDALLAAGDETRAAETDALLAQFWWMKGDQERCLEHLDRADAVVGDLPSPAKARVLSQVARYRALAGEPDAELTARQALELAERFDLDEIRAHALMTTGMARHRAHDLAGRFEAEQGLEIALARNRLPAAIRGYTILASMSEAEGHLAACVRLTLEAEKLAEQLGSSSIRWVRGNLITGWFELGEWDRAAPGADEFLAQSETEGPHYHDAHVLICRALMRLARDELEGAFADQIAGLERARVVKDPQCVWPAVASSAYLLAEAGRVAEAARLLDELAAAGAEAFEYALAYVAWDGELLGRGAEVAAALPTGVDTPWLRAARAIVSRDFLEAASVLESIGARVSAARARLSAAAEFVGQGNRAEADRQLRQALAFYRSIGAKRYVRQGQALLAAAS